MAETPADLTPQRFWQEEDGSVSLDWSDGHQSTISLERLRLGCPCAICREEHSAARSSSGLRALGAGAFRLRRMERVGRYALALVWGDGHSTGIYSWPVLRGLCDCFQCRLERGEL